ncbi:hypothetical protein [Pseudomonas versuta]|jgi:hypothetical protein|uniref:Uncharacterized protein n=1 Tax=Pseudomonas versuta TaxID=1788301 RepID=A0ABX3E6Q4_9PSED|nr:hypothetical protein [Pseudomonas versuta]ALE88061.1 hypothetical protein AOC04_07525 [Pseudomonas versuta]OKA20797.1 hypothetical protein BOH73_13255 [Pseudomonas versuta]
MKIEFFPQRLDNVSVLYEIKGESVVIANGEAFDFSKVEEGDFLPREAINSPWFMGSVTRVNGELALTLLLPNPINYSPEQAFPAPIVVKKSGPLVLPQPLPKPLPFEPVELTDE